MRLSEIIDALTNGCGEKPYCRHHNGLWRVYVADDQLMLTIARMGDNAH